MRTARVVAALFLSAALLHPDSGKAYDFRLGEVEGIVNFTLAYGLLVRTQGRDEELIGIANGGTLPSVNADDGSLNYDIVDFAGRRADHCRGHRS